MIKLGIIMSKYWLKLIALISGFIINSNGSFAADLRPAIIQEKIDKIFEILNNDKGLDIRDKAHDGWHHNGDITYGIMGLNDKKIIRSLIVSKPEKKEMIFMDVGAASGAWGRGVFELLTREFAASDKSFVIVSLTGTYEMEPGVDVQGNVTHYRFNCFKIENIGAELLHKGLDIKGKVDLIVSRWTLRHLVDPLGTLKTLYDHLAISGYLLFDGFFLHLLGNSEPLSPPEMAQFFLDAGLKMLSEPYICNGRSGGNFIFKRETNEPFDVNVAYTGNLCKIRKVDQCFSGYGAQYKRTKELELKEFEDGLDPHIISLTNKYGRFKWFGERSFLAELISFSSDEVPFKEDVYEPIRK